MQEPEGLRQNRTERSRARGSRRRKNGAIACAVLVLVAALAAAVWFSATHGAKSPSQTADLPARSAPTPTAVPVSAAATAAAAEAARVEIPDLTGMSVTQASTMLKAAGLNMRVSVEGTAATTSDVVVRSEVPTAGTVALAGSTVAIVVPAAPQNAARSKPVKKVSGHYVVVIDPGHQSHADDALEPIGPGSAEMKPRITAGATGVISGVPEYEVDLEIATNLKDRLEAAGVHVVMTRTTNDVDISNAQRAEIANAANADLFVRVHADSSTDPTAAGVSTLFPASNQWTKPIVSASRRAAVTMQQHLVAATGAEDGGSAARSDVAGFNWSKVPSILVQTGYQSNAVEDRLLSSAHYQDEVAEGMADGIMAYLDGGR